MKKYALAFGLLLFVLAIFACAGGLKPFNSPSIQNHAAVIKYSVPDTVSDHPSVRRASCTACETPVNENADRLDDDLEAFHPAKYEEFHAGFRDWLTRFSEVEDRSALETEGIQIAAERRVALCRLLETEPERALGSTIPLSIREALPKKVQEQLEERVEGTGSFEVLVETPLPGNGEPKVRRFAQLGGKTYSAVVYGRRANLTSKYNLPMHGIAIDGVLAISQSPVRLLEPGEKIPPGAKVANPDKICPISNKKISAGALAVAGSTYYFLCHTDHIDQLEGYLRAQEGGTSPSVGTIGSIAQSSWTVGNKTVLLINVRFSDQAVSAAHSLSELQAMMIGCDAFVRENSYGATSMTPTFTPLLTLPQNEAYYAANGDTVLYNDARTAATTAGFRYTDYILDAVCWKGGPGGYSGSAFVGIRGCWLKLASAGVAAHEFGHNFGLMHANAWRTTPESVIGAGRNAEYGDSFDTMGSPGAGRFHYNACHKNKLDWLPSANVKTVTSSGTYRITQQDQHLLSAGNFYALKLSKTGDAWGRVYWMDFRQKWTTNFWLMNGVGIHWAPWYASATNNSNAGSQLLDTTPGTQDGTSDSAVVIGQTFSDVDAGIHITPIRKGGTTPESIDVVVNLGNFPVNHAPTLTLSGPTIASTGASISFSAAATDSDGDTLAYAWDFGDRTSGPSSNTVSKSWPTAGDYPVRCTVSDMKGCSTTKFLIVTVGTHTLGRISGQVTNGVAPIAGVRVSATSTNMAWTDSNGNYVITNLPTGSTYTVNASLYGWTFTPSGFTNPVPINSTGINFSGAKPTFSISGKVVSDSTRVSGVTISDGTRTATTDSLGNYTLTGVPFGVYTLTAIKSPSMFSTSGFLNPIVVDGANLTGYDFSEDLHWISGSISGMPSGLTVTVTDGVRNASAAYAGTTYKYGLHVPDGAWNVRAKAAGYTISPSFTNPVFVSGADLPGKNFTSVPGATYSVDGQVTRSGSGLPRVVVSTGSKACTTDTLGKYYIDGLANGSYTLTPRLAGYTFTPASIALAIASASKSGQNFTASGGINVAPVANAQSVTTAEDTGKSITLSAADADGNALTYSIVAAPAHGTLSGIGASRTYSSAANYNGTDSFTFKANDGTADSNVATVAITVTPVNDPPELDSGPTATPNPANVAALVAFFGTASDPDGDALTYSWNFGDSALGTGSSANHAYSMSGTFTATLIVSDGKGGTATGTVVVTVSLAKPAITSALTASGIVGSTFTYTIAASNSPTSYGASGLPAGLTINPTTGVISGTPSAAGTSNVTLSATNAAGTGTATLVLTVASTALDTTDDHLGTVTAQGENGASQGKLMAFDNSTSTKWLDFANAYPATRASWIQYDYAAGVAGKLTGYTITSANDFPARDPQNWQLLGSNDGGSSWIVVDSQSGVVFSARFQKKTFGLSGNPTYKAYRLNILKVANPATANSVQLAEIELLGTQVSFPKPVITSALTAAGVAGSAFTYTIAATNSPASYGATGLPAGLTINTTTGVISGTPSAAGVSNITVSATNAAGTGTATLVLTVAPTASDTTDDHLGAVTAQGENGAPEGKLNAFDNSASTKWLDFANTYPATRASWIQYAYAAGVAGKLTGYTTTSSNDFPVRDPQDWQLLGSNDGGTTWTVVDSQSGVVFSARFQKKTFGLSGNPTYKAYRLNILKVANPATANSVQLSEIELLGTRVPALAPVQGAPSKAISVEEEF